MPAHQIAFAGGVGDGELMLDPELHTIITETSTNVKWIKESLTSTVSDLKKLEIRVDDLESDRDKVKGLTYLGGGGGLAGIIAAIHHFLSKIP
jgi:hypothetical protein